VVRIRSFEYKTRFKREYKKLSPELKREIKAALEDLQREPIPLSRRFEKLEGYRNPNIFTIHVTTNHSHKLSSELVGDRAVLRRIATHSEIDRNP
jgi:mRNA-degrading endonuclease YafQ of YafQ-DinJ toxin-antitoxin module